MLTFCTETLCSTRTVRSTLTFRTETLCSTFARNGWKGVKHQVTYSITYTQRTLQTSCLIKQTHSYHTDPHTLRTGQSSRFKKTLRFFILQCGLTMRTLCLELETPNSTHAKRRSVFKFQTFYSTHTKTRSVFTHRHPAPHTLEKSVLI